MHAANRRPRRSNYDIQALKKSTGATLTTYHVLDGSNNVVGSINVANEQASDLQKHWRDAAPAGAGKQSATATMVAAFKKVPPMNKQAILRGC